MAQFTLNWDNTDVLASANVISQRAGYRTKNAGGVFTTTGFTPANDMAKSVTTADTPSGLTDNLIYQLKIQSICTAGGPTDNDNGIKDMITFACIDPTLATDVNIAGITLNLAGTNITKVRFTLKRSLDNVVMYGPTIVNVVANTATATATGLVAETDYYWEIELYTTLNNIEVKSSDVAFLGVACGPYSITTDEEPVCDPVTAVTVTSIEL